MEVRIPRAPRIHIVSLNSAQKYTFYGIIRTGRTIFHIFSLTLPFSAYLPEQYRPPENLPVESIRYTNT